MTMPFLDGTVFVWAKLVSTCAMSALGQKQTFAVQKPMSALCQKQTFACAEVDEDTSVQISELGEDKFVSRPLQE